jgi:poly(beta-D-mannuronate) lyase
MISVQGPGSDKMAKRTWIHHNYFFNFPPKANNCSAIQIGLSGRSMDSSFCLIEYNLFVKTAGENEGAICAKACNNILRFNTFGEGSDELSLRHGNHSQVYGNFFIGSTGLRFSGDDHKIYSNYFRGCRDAIVCTNGDGEVKEGSKLTCHDRPDRVQVIFNTLIDCKNNFRQPGRANGLGSANITFAGNIIQGGAPVSISGIYLNPVWKDNVCWQTTGGDMPSSGYKINDPKLSPSGFRIDRYGSIPASVRPLTINDVGPGAIALASKKLQR